MRSLDKDQTTSGETANCPVDGTVELSSRLDTVIPMEQRGRGRDGVGRARIVGMPPRALRTLLAALATLAPLTAWATPASQPAARPTALLPIERLNISETEGRELGAALRETLAKRPQLRLLDAAAVAAALAKQPAGCDKRPTCLRELAKRLGATRLLALRAGQLGETTMLRLTLYDRDAVKKGSWQEVLQRRDDATVKAALERMVDGLAPRPVRSAVAATPWYRRWWVWTAVGVAVAGAVTTTVILTRDTRPEPDHVIKL